MSPTRVAAAGAEPRASIYGLTTSHAFFRLAYVRLKQWQPKEHCPPSKSRAAQFGFSMRQ